MHKSTNTLPTVASVSNTINLIRPLLIYLGKLWFFKFQGWVIITINFFNPHFSKKFKKKRLKKKIIKRKLKFLKKIINFFYLNKVDF